MHLLSKLLLGFLGLLSSCVQPVYQHTTYGIESFANDSEEISQGKFAVLDLENQTETQNFSQFLEPVEEKLVDGDELSVILYHPKRPERAEALNSIGKNTGFKIDQGKINLPEMGLIEIDGLTLNEATQKIKAQYREAVANGEIFVAHKKRKARYVLLFGARSPAVSLDRKMRLSEVLAKGGVNASTNFFKSYVQRDDQQLEVDLYQLLHLGDDSQNIWMLPGDKLYLAPEQDSSVIVTGEVRKPRALPVPYGFITLREALAKAEGIPFTGSTNCIQIIRGDFKRPKIYAFNWNETLSLPNDALLLMPGDLVFISEKQITQWNRFIGQLQPSTDCLQTTYNLYELFK